uniref:Evasin n=1 Tax=Amblyomma americanum TaxID=6943 RepID=A0A0C9S3K9_AMBAM
MTSTCFLKFVVLLGGLQATICEATGTSDCKPVLMTTNNEKIQVGCLDVCSHEGRRAVLSEDGKECIDLTLEDARSMQDLNYFCPVGRCNFGTCRRTGATVECGYKE